MVTDSFSSESVWGVPIDRLWKARILDSHNLLPKLLPDFISSVQVLEGDGGVGTIKKLNFAEVVNDFHFVKDKIEFIDNDKYIIRDTVFEGGFIGSRLMSYSFEHKFMAGSEGNTMVKLTVEYESLDEKPLSVEEQNHLIQNLTGVMKAVEGYLLANPNAYV